MLSLLPRTSFWVLCQSSSHLSQRPRAWAFSWRTCLKSLRIKIYNYRKTPLYCDHVSLFGCSGGKCFSLLTSITQCFNCWGSTSTTENCVQRITLVHNWISPFLSIETPATANQQYWVIIVGRRCIKAPPMLGQRPVISDPYLLQWAMSWALQDQHFLLWPLKGHEASGDICWILTCTTLSASSSWPLLWPRVVFFQYQFFQVEYDFEEFLKPNSHFECPPDHPRYGFP